MSETARAIEHAWSTPSTDQLLSVPRMWAEVRSEVEVQARREPILAEYLDACVLNRASLEDALAHALAQRLSSPDVPAHRLREVIDAAYAENSALARAACHDLQAVRERDPASESYSEALLYFKGFHALQGYRIAHWLWRQGREALALFFQSRISQVFAVDIHPAARIGTGIMIDHATSVVIGETAVIEDNVSILHEVTLGGTGKETGDRHPKIRHGVLIGAGAKLLGNVEVGEGAKVGAGSVVLDDVPPHCTVVGVPAVIVGRAECDVPARSMDHRLPGCSKR